MNPAPPPDRSALVVVDYQNDFCHVDGAISKLGQDTESARVILPNVKRLVDLARAAGVPRIFVRVSHSEWTDSPSWVERGSGATILDTKRIPVAREGTWGARLYELEPRDDELVLTKHRYSAFAFTPLMLALQAKGADHIVLAGVQTNVCVHATARDAVQTGFLPVIVEDCVAAATDTEHEVALADIKARLGSVVSLNDVAAAWNVPAIA
ncbi:MAG: cysteine hydrolase family protein [Actinomycetota bacterium]